VDATDLTDGGESTLHYHDSDRDRTNHTGTQAISTVVDLQTELDAKALKSNVLELDNTDAFTPDADYEPATKKYVDDNAGGDLKVYYAESLAQSSTTSDNFQNKVTLTLPSGLIAGDYFIEVNYGWRYSSYSYKFESRVQLDYSDLGTNTHYQEPQDSNNRHTAFRRFKRTLAGGTHTIELDYRRATDDSGTAYIWDASITVTKINIQS